MAKRSLALLLFAPVGLYLAALVAIALFVTHPPALGWIGLGLASVVALLAATIALLLFTRGRANVARAHPHQGAVHRLLVVTDVDIEPDELSSAVKLRLVGRPATQVRVVAPVLASGVHLLADDEKTERAEAQVRLQHALRALDAAGIKAHGLVGADDPLQTVGDALAGFPADEVLLVAALEPHRGWVDRHFEERARDLYDLPVSTVFGPALAAR